MWIVLTERLQLTIQENKVSENSGVEEVGNAVAPGNQCIYI